MVVLLLAVEREVLVEQEIADRDALMMEEAQAYRTRSRWLTTLGRAAAAETDRQRAEQLEQEARELKKSAPTGVIEVVNRWHEPVTLLIDGASCRLAVGETRQITKAAGPFRYELPATRQVSQGQLQAGQTFRLEVR
jgi:hypothetical protein